MDIINNIKIGNLTRTAKQTIILYSSQIIAMVLGVLFTIVNTRYLSKEDFGTFNFFIQFVTFLALIFEFGFFAAGSRLIALQKAYSKEREIIGSLFIIGLFLSLFFVVLLFISSFFVDSIFNSNIKYLLLITLIPAAAFPFQYLFQLIFQGSNELIKLSLYTVLPRILYFLAIFFALYLGFFNLTLTASFYVLTIFVSTLLMIFLSRPRFNDFRDNFRLIKEETKSYGFQVYSGRVAGMMGYQSNILLIQYFVYEIQVANFSLINFFTTPISIFSRSLCTALFKGMANQNKIPARVFKINFLWLIIVSILFIVFGGYVIELLFSKKYTEAIPLILPLTLANFFQGAFQPYNFFLSAKGRGKYLRNTAILLTVSTIFFNLLLIPYFSSMGAAYATLISLFLDYLIHYYYYRKTIKEIENDKRETS